MLRLGESKPWQEALEQLTGTREMSARPILEFFKPLSVWLKKTNLANGDIPGW
jgi:peptidyl-dipeptidase A